MFWRDIRKTSAKVYNDVLVRAKSFSFETAEPWLKNKWYHPLYPSFLHHILGEKTSTETKVCAHPCSGKGFQRLQLLVVLIRN